ncbi:MAG: autotransporter-associated beta strand repeat-containing protein [Kiritimatiellae bacterium]|nr:autotransporter-associated beta strand repeat-containing protein [Kiritimatiellia bacterium]
MSSSNEYLRHSSSVAAAVAAAMFAVAPAIHADTVTLAPAEGTTTNVLALYTGDTAVEINGPGTVKLNNSNSHTGGTTLSGGTLEISGDVTASGRSPVGAGTFTITGGTLRGSGTFGGNITGEGEFNVEAPDGWKWTGNHSFASPVTLAEGSLTVADGAMTFSDNLWLGVGGSDVSFTMTGGSITMGSKNPHFSPKKYAKSRFSITGGSFNANGRNVLTGYQTTYATNTFDVSGNAVFYNVGNIYTYSGSGNVMDINVHDGGTLDCSAIYNGNDTAGTAKTNLRVDGGILRCNKKGSTATSYALWIGQTSANVKRQLTSFTIGPKGATFTTDNGDASGVMQIYSPITAEAAGAGETAAGVTLSGGRFAYYVPTAYEGPTIIKDGATLYLSADGTIPSGSAVTVKSGSMLRLQGADKTISSLTLEEGAALGFGTPSSGANSAVLTVSGSVTLPRQAQIALYTLATPAGVAKDANGTYAVLEVPAASAAALRAVRWSCATIADGKTATFAVTESGGTATLSVTIADSDAATTSGDITVGSGEFVSLSSSLDVGSRTVTVDGGWLKTSASLTGTGAGGQVIVENGGLLDVWNYVRFSTAANAHYDLYVRNGGIVRAQLFSPQDAYKAYVDGALHIDGGTLQFVFQTGTSDNYKNPNFVSTYIGAGGATFDLSHWNDKGRTGWLRFVCENLKFYHDPNCVGADGGITVCGSNGDPILYYFKSIDSASTMNGGITVADGGVVSTVGGLNEQTVRIRPGGMFRGYNATSTATIESLVLGEANATKPAEIVVCRNSTVPTIVVTDTLSVFSPVTVSVAQGWSYDAAIASGVYTALVYQASCNVDTSLFQLPAGCAGTLSASEVTLSGGDYDGWKALVVTIDNAIVVTGATEYPSPKTVSSDASCDSIVVGGSWNGVADPVCETSLTVSGNVMASTGLYLGYNPAPGVDKDDWHQGFLTLNGGSITTPLLYSIYRPGMTGNNDSDCRFGCEATVNGGLLDVAGDVRLAYNRSKNGNNLYSQLTVNGGRVAVGGKFYLFYDETSGAYSAPGSIVLNGGEVDVKGLIDLTRNAQKPSGNLAYAEKFGVWLNGGVLKAENIMMTATTATSPQLVFNGGTYMPYGVTEANRTMQNLNVAYVSTNGAIISTENLPAGETYTIAQPLLTAPALGGAADGGLTKKGAGTLELTGDNTFTGLTKVEAGTLVAGSADALSDSVAVANGAALDANGADLSVGTITASGAVNGNLTITNAIVLAGEGSILSVDGNLALQRGVTIDFAAFGGNVPRDWTPVAAVSGSPSVTDFIRARNSGDYNRCMPMIVDGVLYVMPTSAGFTIVVK